MAVSQDHRWWEDGTSGLPTWPQDPFSLGEKKWGDIHSHTFLGNMASESKSLRSAWIECIRDPFFFLSMHRNHGGRWLGKEPIHIQGHCLLASMQFTWLLLSASDAVHVPAQLDSWGLAPQFLKWTPVLIPNFRKTTFHPSYENIRRHSINYLPCGVLESGEDANIWKLI